MSPKLHNIVCSVGKRIARITHTTKKPNDCDCPKFAWTTFRNSIGSTCFLCVTSRRNRRPIPIRRNNCRESDAHLKTASSWPRSLTITNGYTNSHSNFRLTDTTRQSTRQCRLLCRAEQYGIMTIVRHFCSGGIRVTYIWREDEWRLTWICHLDGLVNVLQVQSLIEFSARHSFQPGLPFSALWWFRCDVSVLIQWAGNNNKNLTPKSVPSQIVSKLCIFTRNHTIHKHSVSHKHSSAKVLHTGTHNTKLGDEFATISVRFGKISPSADRQKNHSGRFDTTQTRQHLAAWWAPTV